MPELERAEFEERLQSQSPEPLDASVLAALHAHYRLLVRWNERTSLIGPGTLDVAVDVHYGESLAALPLIPHAGPRTLVDIGSGAGFPGFVLAVARPNLRGVLVEARERKWSFLKAIAAETGIAVECLLGTVDRSLPKGFPGRVDYVSLRALTLPPRAWQALSPSLAERARALIWAGREDPQLPAGSRITRSVAVPGSRWKRILVVERAGADGSDHAGDAD